MHKYSAAEYNLASQSQEANRKRRVLAPAKRDRLCLAPGRPAILHPGLVQKQKRGSIPSFGCCPSFVD